MRVRKYTGNFEHLSSTKRTRHTVCLLIFLSLASKMIQDVPNLGKVRFPVLVLLCTFARVLEAIC